MIDRSNQSVHRDRAARAIRASTVLCTALVVLATGCGRHPGKRRSFFPPPPERKSIEQLYFEAVAQARPEINLGLHDSPNSHGQPGLTTSGIPTELDLLPVQDPLLQTVPETVPGDPSIPYWDLNPAFPAPPPQLEPHSPGTVRTTVKPGTWRRRGQPPGLKPDMELAIDQQIERSPIRRVVNEVAAPTAAPEDDMVSDFFEETDIRQAIQSMATQAGVSVIMDDQVAGVISVVIEDEAFEPALRKVLLPLGFVYKKQDDGSYLIGVTDPASPLFAKIAARTEYRPVNMAPQDLFLTLPERLKPFVRVIDKRNLMLIEAPEEILQEVVSQLQRTDSPIPQVMLEAIICVVAPDSGFRFGLDWNHAVQLNGKNALNLGLSGLALEAGMSPQGLSNAFSDFAFTSAFVQLLAQEGYLTIRASPRVMARDGERAEISIARQSFFSIQPQSADVFFRQDIREVEAGIEMVITPVVRGDNVQVSIERAEVSEDIRSQSSDPNLVNNPFPLINRRRVSTNVTVKDGQTIVIGGLVSKQTVDRLSEIPVFGRIPRLGGMFKKIEKQEQEAEVVIFISPKIIQDMGPAIITPGL